MFDINKMTQTKTVDQGLRSYMLLVYNYMSIALLLTGVVAYAGIHFQPLARLLFVPTFGGIAPSGMCWLIFLAQFVVVYMFASRISYMPFDKARMLFWTYSVLMGLGLAPVLVSYTGVSVSRVFFITAATFGSMSLYGYTTKRDLTNLGSFAFMALIGIILSSIVNIFLQSGMVYFITSVLGVVVFTILAAYDTQKIRSLYYAGDTSPEMQHRKALSGALSLYIDFINLFVIMLRFFGDRR